MFFAIQQVEALTFCDLFLNPVQRQPDDFMTMGVKVYYSEISGHKEV